MKHCLVRYANMKPSTRKNMQRCADFLIDHFGSNRQLHTISIGDADDFRQWLMHKQSQAETTASEICRKSKTLFKKACDKRWMETNPFGEMKDWVNTNDERQYFVKKATINRVLKHCEPEWQLIIALARYGGLRCPSEVLGLRWQWINFEEERFTVWAPKTERYVRKKFRTVPMFFELAPFFREAWERAETGAEYVVTVHRATKNALRSGFEKRLARAGVAAWPRLFQNLRSTRQSELCDMGFPEHTVAAWAGEFGTRRERPLPSGHGRAIHPSNYGALSRIPKALQKVTQRIGYEKVRWGTKMVKNPVFLRSEEQFG